MSILPTFKIMLRNGSEITSTKDHKFILADDTEVLMKDLKIGDVLKQNDKIVLDGMEEIDIDYWFIKGLYIADGWSSARNWISISGKDGKPKEKQKELVKEFCEKNDILWKCDDKSIRFKSEKLYNDFVKCGKHAINKKVGILPRNSENINALLRGLQADAYIRADGNITYGTISTHLKNDIKQLYRMIGVSCYEKLVAPCRTQFGKNHIWRIYPRLRKFAKLKIMGITRNIEEHVYDIEVENNEIYLPENDCVVHNCDDVGTFKYCCLVSALVNYNFISDLWRLKTMVVECITGGHHYILTWLKNSETGVIGWLPIETTYFVSTFAKVWHDNLTVRKNIMYKIIFSFDERAEYKKIHR